MLFMYFNITSLLLWVAGPFFLLLGYFNVVSLVLLLLLLRKVHYLLVIGLPVVLGIVSYVQTAVGGDTRFIAYCMVLGVID